VDACGVDTTVFFPNIINCSNLGTVPVTITSYDFYGNTSTCISLVNVVLDGAEPSALDSFLCEGQPLQLYANPPPTGFTYDYVWSGPGFSSNAQNPQIGNMQGVNEGSYIVTIIPQGLPGCIVSDTVHIDVNVVPPPIVTMDGLACFGDSISFYFANQAAYSGTNFTYKDKKIIVDERVERIDTFIYTKDIIYTYPLTNYKKSIIAHDVSVQAKMVYDLVLDK
jgi:hypothetical protein